MIDERKTNNTLIIAEIGECWNGDISQAEKLMQIAKDVGCDYAKFQTLDREGIAEDDPERDWFLKIALDRSQLEHLQQYAREIGIRFLATPEKMPQAQLLWEMRCEDVKIASSCLVDDELLEFVNGKFNRVFLSTGLAELEEIDRALDFLDRVPELYLLHCISEYPTGPLLEERGLVALAEQDVHLAMMGILAQRYPQVRVGYSDHTVGLLAPIIAVAAGAQVIEKHITLDRKTPVEQFLQEGEYLGTDHVLSLEPEELKEMVAKIRQVEAIVGLPQWSRSPGELKLREFMRERFHHDEKDTP